MSVICNLVRSGPDNNGLCPLYKNVSGLNCFMVEMVEGSVSCGSSSYYGSVVVIVVVW